MVVQKRAGLAESLISQELSDLWITLGKMT
ncbi:hypothetical protein N879_13495 [Alcaligenes sp. EGD-AK7]|nr:hypothetical protein N879_13495 [Alcaligenes sp. EGD-AK7]